jgi:hypothetical protein
MLAQVGEAQAVALWLRENPVVELTPDCAQLVENLLSAGADDPTGQHEIARLPGGAQLESYQLPAVHEPTSG